MRFTRRLAYDIKIFALRRRRNSKCLGEHIVPCGAPVSAAACTGSSWKTTGRRQGQYRALNRKHVAQDRGCHDGIHASATPVFENERPERANVIDGRPDGAHKTTCGRATREAP